MLLRQFHLGNNLPTHTGENKDFLRLKLRRILKADIKTVY